MEAMAPPIAWSKREKKSQQVKKRVYVLGRKRLTFSP
jgi:hypothetical protein